MSEKHHGSHEHFETSPEHHEHAHEVKHETVNVSHEKSRQAEKLKEAIAEVTKESTEKDKVLEKLAASEESPDQDYVHRQASSDLKKNAFKNEIRHIRRKLSKTDRVGSKLIHQPFVKTVSEVSSKTITRPSGLLGGGITAFIGTSVYLYLTKHIGLKYNYSIFLFLLVAGFALGLVIEALVRMSRAKRAV